MSSHFMMMLISLLIMACSQESQPSSKSSNEISINEIDKKFTHPKSGDLEITYECAKTQSKLIYYLKLAPNNILQIQFEVDTGETFRFEGNYRYENEKLTFWVTHPNYRVNEQVTSVIFHLGLLYEFQSNSFRCRAIGHEYNNVTNDYRKYSCPYVSAGAGSDEQNVIELNALSIHGSVFRQYDIWPTGSSTPIVHRGYGVFRTINEEIYIYFPNQFKDYSTLTGLVNNAESSIVINEFKVNQKQCYQ